MKREKNDGRGKIKLSLLIYSIVLFVVFSMTVFSVYVYKFSKDNFVTSGFGKFLFLPAVVINGDNFIFIRDVSDNLNSIKSFYENQDFASLGYRVDFSTPEGKKRLKIRERELLNKMVEDKAIVILAKERGIKITDQMVSEAVDRKLSESSNGQSAVDNLKKLYGWSLNDFKRKIVKPSLYKDALKKWVDDNDGKSKRTEAKRKIEESKNELSKGVSFSEVAEKMNKNEGHIGWFKLEFLNKKLQNEVVAMKIGDVSGVLETEVGYHILKLNDKKNENDEEYYDLSQIFFPKLNFAEWLDKKMKAMRVKVLLNEFYWNKEKAVVEFESEEMKKFEKKELNSSQRDISLMAL